jgi:hypothetical protein
LAQNFDDFVVIFLKTEVKSLHGHDAIAEFTSSDQGASNEAKDNIKADEVIASCPLHDNCVSSHTPCLTVCIVTCLKTEIAEPERPPTAKERLFKHVPTATNTRATTQELMQNSNTTLEMVKTVSYAVRAEAT